MNKKNIFLVSFVGFFTFQASASLIGHAIDGLVSGAITIGRTTAELVSGIADLSDSIKKHWQYATEITLSEVIRLGNIDLLKKIINSDIINKRDSDHFLFTPLMHAAINNQVSIAEFLLTIPGIDVNAQNEYGSTALMIACIHGHEKMVELLLKAGGSKTAINVNIQDTHGQTALITALIYAKVFAYHAQQFYKNEIIIKLLLDFPGLMINAQDKEGQTATDYALAMNLPAIHQLIKDKIKELTSKAFVAVEHGDIETLKAVIVKIGTDLVDSSGNTLLDKAFSSHNVKAVEFLLMQTKDPRDELARFPFESANPTSVLFKFCLDIAYAQPDYPAKVGPKKETSCAFCSTEDCTERCSKCQQVYYCSVQCQKADWLVHKNNCTLTN